MADLDFAISLDTKDDWAYANRAYVKFELGKYADAVFDFDKAIKFDPDYSDYYYKRGLAYDKLKRCIDALYDFERTIKLNPNDYSGYYHSSGVEKIHLARYQQAIADFDQAIKLAPKNAVAYNGRGVAKENMGRYDAAIADYDQAIKLDPTNELFIKNRNRVMKAKNAFAANQNNAEPLGLKLGFTPLSAVREKDDDMQEDGYSKWTDGKKFISKGTVHNIEGAKSITYIYNEEDLLDVVIIVMHKDYFSKVNSYLKSKYKLRSASIPPVGDKYAKYIQGNSIVEIDAPHLSFEMEVIYKTVSFDTAFRTKKAAEAMERNSKQKSKF